MEEEQVLLLLLFSSPIFSIFSIFCPERRALKNNASIYFFPPRTLRARLHEYALDAVTRDRMVASTALFQPTTLLRLVLLYLQRRDDDDETDEQETTVTKALVSVLSSQFQFVRFTDIFWAYLAATATVFSRSVVKSNAVTSEWSLLDGVTVGLETVVGRGTVASGIGAGQIYGVGYEVTSSAAAAINQVFEQQYDFRKRTRRRKLLDVNLKAYAASVSRNVNATKLASMIVNRRRSVKNTSRKLLFEEEEEADDIERNMLHTLVPMFLSNVPVSVRDEFIQSLQSVIIDPSLVLSFELNIARVNVLIPRKGYSAFENAQLFRTGQRNLWSGYLQRRRSGVGASFSSAVGASFSPGDKLAFDIQDTTEKLKAATDILDQLNADRVAKAHFSNATKIDVDPFNLPDGSVVPDSEPIGVASLTYAITISINFGQRIGVLA